MLLFSAMSISPVQVVSQNQGEHLVARVHPVKHVAGPE
jgi:hypothetical protein